MPRLTRLALPAAIALIAGSAHAGPGSLVGVGDIPGGPVFSEAFGVSPDGSIVVGASSVTGTNQVRAFSWTRDGGIVNLGTLSGGVARTAYMVNDAGIFAGESTTPEAATGNVAGGALTLLGGTVPNGFFGSSAYGMSTNGSRLVGSRELSGFIIQACRWDGTTLSPLPFVTGGGFFSFANACSGDGSIIVGQSDSANGYLAFKWSAGAGTVSLGDIAGGDENSTANAISRDGSTIVGNGRGPSATEAVKWNSAGGLTPLGDLAGGTLLSNAFGVSADGSTIVGYGTPASGGRRAVVWSGSGGPTLLTDLLEAKGVDTTNWQLQTAAAVSDDGLTIVGTAVNPAGETTGFVAYLGTPCISDVNNDGVTDLVDFFQFLNDFDTSAAGADVNYDDVVDLSDFFEFLNAFDVNC